MKRSIKVAPSILSADFSRLGDEVRAVEREGCDLIHVDVMDGHFVPNLTIGPVVVKHLRRCTRLTLDVHLMIEDPQKFITPFAEAGADQITVHVEACGDALRETLQAIRELGCSPGVSLRPQTSVDILKSHYANCDRILVMTVNPGFGGQAFMPEMLPKIAFIRSQFEGEIEVDGGINAQTAGQVIRAGADVLVAGTAVFGAANRREMIQKLKQIPTEDS
ncbi:MAG: ribulose-phosphate 3-epimerase [Candidatus Omnitrophica bacterium]|nr:ribulose-phosphate 3-epimerase [Candidatus Omnitrophota bacterium]